MAKSRKAIYSFLITIMMLMTSTFASNVQAAGIETLPPGEHYIGGFTFTNTNLTPVKTLPRNTRTLGFIIRFCKSPIDKGIGRVKLNVQVRDINGKKLAEKTLQDTSDITGWRDTEMFISVPDVYEGQKIQIFFDALSVNPAESNGNFRSIWVTSFLSYVNVPEIQS